MPTGTDYRFLYVVLYNKGKGFSFEVNHSMPASKTIEQMLMDKDYEIVYSPAYDGDITVGKKDGDVIGVASLYGLWAINLSEHT